MMCLALNQNRGTDLSSMWGLTKTFPNLETLHGLRERAQGQEDILLQCPEELPFRRCPEVHLAAESK